MLGKRDAAIGFIFVTMLIDVIGFGIIIPILPDLIKELTHGTLSDASRYGLRMNKKKFNSPIVCQTLEVCDASDRGIIRDHAISVVFE